MPEATTLTLNKYPNYQYIHAHLTIDTEDVWDANTIAVTGRYLYRGRYFPMHEWIQDGQDTSNWYGVVFGLNEGDYIQLQVIFTRTRISDGAVLESIVTTDSSTTRVSPSADNYTDICWVNPTTGDNNNDGTTKALAKKTIRDASFFGDRVVIVDGTYGYDDFLTGSFDNSNNYASPQTGFDGTAAIYKSIAAETPGGVTLTGIKPMDGTWTRASANLYYHTLVGFRFAEGIAGQDLTLGPGMIRRTSDGYILHLYASVAALTTGAYGEGFVIDWANSRIYVKTPTDATPSSTDYEASSPANFAMTLVNCDYLIIDGIIFDMFAQADQNGDDVSVHTTQPALNISNCTDVVIRNCTFTVGGIKFIGGNNARITIEDNTFTDYDPWARIESQLPAIDPAMWAEYKQSSRNERAMINSTAGGNTQIVIRRNTISRCWTVLNVTGGSGNDHGDIYDNVMYRIFDDTIECDGSGSTPESGCTNIVICNNTITNCGSAFSFTPYAEGPAWVINNTVVNWWFANGVIRKGTSSASDGEWGAGPTLFYNNTCVNTLHDFDGTDEGMHCWATNNSQSNSRIINNIFTGTGRFYWSCSIGSLEWMENSPDVLFKTNAFYTSIPVAFHSPFVWDQEDWPTEAEAQVDAGDGQLQVSGNVYGTNPFTDLSVTNDVATLGSLTASLTGIGTSIPGITNLAADADGHHIIEPLDVGSFAMFIQESVPEEGTRGQLQTNNFTRPN